MENLNIRLAIWSILAVLTIFATVLILSGRAVSIA